MAQPSKPIFPRTFLSQPVPISASRQTGACISSLFSMGALSPLRVLDLSRVLAAPWATQILGDLGAEVIKIEKPGEGDETRRFGPPFLTSQDGSPGDAAYFLTANRNKKSVTVDMATEEGQ